MIQKPYLSATEIVTILKECRKCGVTKFALADMSVEFAVSSKVSRKTEQFVPIDVVLQETEEKKVILAEEAEAKADRLARMVVEDPVAYEREIISGDLERAQTI